MIEMTYSQKEQEKVIVNNDMKYLDSLSRRIDLNVSSFVTAFTLPSISHIILLQKALNNSEAIAELQVTS